MGVGLGANTRASLGLGASAASGVGIAADWLKNPAGGVAWPSKFRPQQAAEPPFSTPQVCPLPALTDRKEPVGGVAWPSLS